MDIEVDGDSQKEVNDTSSTQNYFTAQNTSTITGLQHCITHAK